MREIRKGHDFFMRRARITPAPAGNTFKKTHDYPFSRDHPRTCGKYTKRFFCDATYNLSIPFFHSLLNVLNHCHFLYYLLLDLIGQMLLENSFLELHSNNIVLLFAGILFVFAVAELHNQAHVL